MVAPEKLTKEEIQLRKERETRRKRMKHIRERVEDATSKLVETLKKGENRTLDRIYYQAWDPMIVPGRDEPDRSVHLNPTELPNFPHIREALVFIEKKYKGKFFSSIDPEDLVIKPGHPKMEYGPVIPRNQLTLEQQRKYIREEKHRTKYYDIVDKYFARKKGIRPNFPRYNDLITGWRKDLLFPPPQSDDEEMVPYKETAIDRAGKRRKKRDFLELVLREMGSFLDESPCGKQNKVRKRKSDGSELYCRFYYQEIKKDTVANFQRYYYVAKNDKKTSQFVVYMEDKYPDILFSSTNFEDLNVDRYESPRKGPLLEPHESQGVEEDRRIIREEMYQEHTKKFYDTYYKGLFDERLAREDAERRKKNVIRAAYFTSWKEFFKEHLNLSARTSYAQYVTCNFDPDMVEKFKKWWGDVKNAEYSLQYKSKNFSFLPKVKELIKRACGLRNISDQKIKEVNDSEIGTQKIDYIVALIKLGGDIMRQVKLFRVAETNKNLGTLNAILKKEGAINRQRLNGRDFWNAIADKLIADFNQLCYLIDEGIEDQDLFQMIEENNGSNRRQDQDDQGEDATDNPWNDFFHEHLELNSDVTWYSQYMICNFDRDMVRKFKKWWKDKENANYTPTKDFPFLPDIKEIVKRACGLRNISNQKIKEVNDSEIGTHEIDYVLTLVELAGDIVDQTYRFREAITENDTMIALKESEGTNNRIKGDFNAWNLIADALVADFNQLCYLIDEGIGNRNLLQMIRRTDESDSRPDTDGQGEDPTDSTSSSDLIDFDKKLLKTHTIEFIKVKDKQRKDFDFLPDFAEMLRRVCGSGSPDHRKIVGPDDDIPQQWTVLHDNWIKNVEQIKTDKVANDHYFTALVQLADQLRGAAVLIKRVRIAGTIMNDFPNPSIDMSSEDGRRYIIDLLIANFNQLWHLINDWMEFRRRKWPQPSSHSGTRRPGR